MPQLSVLTLARSNNRCGYKRRHDREARADGQRGELIARIAAGARQSASMGAAGVFDTYLATSGWDFCTGVGSPRGYFSK